MKKYRILGALLAGAMAVTGIPAVTPSLMTSVSAASKLAAPKDVKAVSTGASEVKVTWSAVKGAAAYRVYKYNAKTGKYETYKNVSGTHCVVRNLEAGKTYKFRVAALVKSGSKYTVQKKSGVVSVKVKGSSSSSSSSPFELPKFGTKVKAAFNSIGVSQYLSVDSGIPGMKLYGGLKKISGSNCMVLLYCDADDTVFGALVTLSPEVIKYSTAVSKLKKSLGSDYHVVQGAMELYIWMITNELITFIAGKDDSSAFVYASLDISLAPDSFKSNQSDIFNSLDNLSSSLNNLGI